MSLQQHVGSFIQEAIFSTALGIESPWSVESVSFDAGAKRLDVRLAFKRGSRIESYGVGGAKPCATGTAQRLRMSRQASRFPRESRPMQCIGEMPALCRSDKLSKNADVPCVGTSWRACGFSGWRKDVSLAGISELPMAKPTSARYVGHAQNVVDHAAEARASPRLGTYWHCRRDARTGAANLGRSVDQPSRPGWDAELVVPTSAKREQRFSAEGVRKPRVERGKRSQGRSVRSGDQPAQARLCKRGRLGRKPHRTPKGILDSAGGFSPCHPSESVCTEGIRFRPVGRSASGRQGAAAVPRRGPERSP